MAAGDGPVRGYARHVDWLNSVVSPEEISLGRFVESPLAHPSVMFRRELIERFGGYRAGDFPEDYDLWLRWLDAGVQMAKVPETLPVWNDPPDRLSRVDPRYRVAAFFHVKAQYLARWLERNNPHHPRVALWGAGRITRRRFDALWAGGVEPECYVDVRKVGRVIGGKPVIAAETLPQPGEMFVVVGVGSAGARERNAAWLTARGWSPGEHFICAA